MDRSAVCPLNAVLSGLVPPQLTGDSDSLTNVTATLHGSLTLLCEAAGVPPPTVQWFREGQPISPGEDTYLLAGKATSQMCFQISLLDSYDL